jgi:hypothetical protein
MELNYWSNFSLCNAMFNAGRQVVFRVAPEEYSYLISEFATFRVHMHSYVDETEQLSMSFTDVSFIVPKVTVSVCVQLFSSTLTMN